MRDASHTTTSARGDDGDTFRRTGRIMIVGACLAGLRAAATLHQQGFTGSLTLIGDEPHEPYDRPPLSKQVLDGWVPAQRSGLPRPGGLDAQWRSRPMQLGGEQDLPDRGCSDLHPEHKRLLVYPPISPAAVVPCQPPHQG
jgi:hypothetical protein